MKKTLNPMAHRLFHGLVGLVVFALSGCMQPLTPVVSDLLTTNPAEEGTLPAVQISVKYETDTDSDLGLCNSTTRWLWEASGSFDVTTPLFRWRLNSGSWQTTHATEYAQDNLPFGRHTFELQVRNARGQWFPLGSQSVDIAAARYRGNGHTHGMPPFDGSAYAPGDVVTLAEPPVDFARGNTVFQGWVISSVEDQPIQPGATISFPDDVCSIDLIAQWGLEGSGTPDGPYIVSSPEGLRLLSERDDMWADGTHIQLTEDIDLTEFTNWEPIGSTSDPFSGTFDGQGYRIEGVNITTDSGDDELGLFGHTDNATIRDLHVHGTINASSSNFVGLLVGQASETTIERVSASGSVRGNQIIGGLVGQTRGGQLTRAHTDVDVTSNGPSGGFSDLGGLIGDAGGGTTLLRTSATGTVTASGRNAGGLVGWYAGSEVTIEQSWASGNVTISGPQGGAGGLVGAGGTIRIIDSYATGDVSTGTSTTERRVGGLVGSIRTNGIIERSWSRGKITEDDEGGFLGGLIGGTATGRVTASFWDKDNSGMSESAGGKGKTSDAMKDQNTFTDWDFTNTWELTNNQFPTLRENPPRSPQSGP